VDWVNRERMWRMWTQRRPPRSFPEIGYYWFARANGLGIYAASAYTLTASALWEFAREWREKASINDMVTTTFAGIAVGEFLHQLSSYLNSSPGPTNAVQDVAKSTLGFPVWVNQKWDGREPLATGAARDDLGLSAAYQHRFSLGYDSSWLSDTAAQRQQLGGVVLGARLASLAGYGEPEAFATTFAGGNFASASLDLGFDKQGFREARLAFDRDTARLLCAAGRARAARRADRARHRRGVLDPRHAARERRICARALLRSRVARQLAAQGLRRTAACSCRCGLRCHSLVGLCAVHAADPNAVYKSSLADQGYRFQEELTRDLPGTERIADYRAGVVLQPAHLPVGIRGRTEGALHESELGGKSATRRETRWVAGTGFVF
jgi:hypothetical protein